MQVRISGNFVVRERRGDSEKRLLSTDGGRRGFIMSLRSLVVAVLLGFLTLCSTAVPLRAALTAQEKTVQPTDLSALEMRQYRITDARIPGPVSARQSVTAWQITSGTWNGQELSGLSLVMVRSQPEDGRALPTTNCYISQTATPAQREALIGAFIATLPPALRAVAATAMRIEPAVITFEFDGHTIVLHVGLVA